MTAPHVLLVGSNCSYALETSSAWGEETGSGGTVAAFSLVFGLTVAVDRKRGERKIERVVAGTTH